MARIKHKHKSAISGRRASNFSGHSKWQGSFTSDLMMMKSSPNQIFKFHKSLLLKPTSTLGRASSQEVGRKIKEKKEFGANHVRTSEEKSEERCPEWRRNAPKWGENDWKEEKITEMWRKSLNSRVKQYKVNRKRRRRERRWWRREEEEEGNSWFNITCLKGSCKRSELCRRPKQTAR